MFVTILTCSGGGFGWGLYEAWGFSFENVLEASFGTTTPQLKGKERGAKGIYGYVKLVILMWSSMEIQMTSLP